MANTTNQKHLDLSHSNVPWPIQPIKNVKAHKFRSRINNIDLFSDDRKSYPKLVKLKLITNRKIKNSFPYKISKMNNFDTLLTNISRNNIHPPPEIDEVLTFFNSKKPMRDHNRCHAYMILRYSVAKECKRIGKFNAILIRKVADHLWKTSTTQEKLEYANLAQRVKSH
ncbi:hypothetical protein Glove_310g16 [Diversispora epigaea]|uniref:HMG box domain-containing protein n=1 Tax=Diversispora epigaea TaxID=1348612 RepID=A0A397HSU5_9GLOM|nr:hypothetical protein Glove_310g16 [Diversispora epigaea]